MSLPTNEPESSATFIPAVDTPRLELGATTAHLVATGSLTEGRYGLFRWDMTADSGGASPHFHTTFSEAFYVLEGAVAVYDGTSWRDARAGDFLYVPPRGVHAFHNESGAVASMLIMFAPGAPRERYFQELVERASSDREYSDEEQRGFLARHDQFEA
jgi:mannose-6-phosphate isomerase-like protein (cupin superfamily)